MKKINQQINRCKFIFILLFLVLASLITNAQAFIDATNDVATVPVSYLNFTGYEYNNTVVLKWATTREINNSHFIIQKSSNGIVFENLNKVNGKGNSASVNDYSFTDDKLVDGIFYYRLQQVDFDGQSSYSSIVIIKKSKENQIELNIYPNPFFPTSNAYLSLKGLPQGSYQYSIINTSGQLISSTPFNQLAVVSTQQIKLPNNLQSGIYTLLIQNIDGKKIGFKQIIVR